MAIIREGDDMAKAVILAAGRGTRLQPMTTYVPKQLLPVYDRPLIHHGIDLLLDSGFSEIAIVIHPSTKSAFQSALANYQHITLIEQSSADGIVSALLAAEHFIDEDPFTLLLGDNLFIGGDVAKRLNQHHGAVGATLYGVEVEKPSAFGVAVFEGNRLTAIEEKPIDPPSPWAVVGLYQYDAQCCTLARRVTPSARGEYEITDLNNLYLEQEQVRFEPLHAVQWFDTGTPTNLLQASVCCYQQEQMVSGSASA